MKLFCPYARSYFDVAEEFNDQWGWNLVIESNNHEKLK